MSDVEIRIIDLLDPLREGEAQEWIGVHAAVQRDIFGERGSAWTLEEIRGLVRGADKKRVALVARSAAAGVVGALEVHLPLRDNQHAAMLWLSVLPSARGRGVGSALLRAGEMLAAEHGRTTVLVESEWAQGSDGAESFATTHGYTVAQTVLRSEQSLPVDRSVLRELVDAAGADAYVLESYVDEMPEAWLEDRAVLQQRMSTDAPADDLDIVEEVWDVDRLRASNARWRPSGRRVVETAARHRPSGRLVGFTQASVSAGEPELTYQQDTLVLREHRGHGLGLRLKAANTMVLMDALPGVTAVRTWNAASNEHMLAVNRRLGYVVDGYSREWQKRL